MPSTRRPRRAADRLASTRKRHRPPATLAPSAACLGQSRTERAPRRRRALSRRRARRPPLPLPPRTPQTRAATRAREEDVGRRAALPLRRRPTRRSAEPTVEPPLARATDRLRRGDGLREFLARCLPCP